MAEFETNPWTREIPESIENPDLQDYLSEQAEILREQHEFNFAEQPQIPIEQLAATYDSPVYILGSIGQFHSETYGRIDAVFVQFKNMTGANDRVVGFTADSFEYEVSNNYALSDPGLAVGVLPYATAPADNLYGWVIIAGTNTQAVGLKTGDSITRGNRLGWTSTGKLGETHYGLTLAVSLQGSSQTDSAAAGSLLIQRFGQSDQAALDAADTRIEALETWQAATSTRLDGIDNSITTLTNDLASQMSQVDGNLDELSAAITRETQLRRSGDEILATQITQLSASVSDQIGAAVTTESEARANADSALATMVDNAVAAIYDDLTEQQQVFAEASSTLSATVTETEANATAISAVKSFLYDPTTGLAALSTAVTTLDTRVTTNEGDITTNASAITAVNSRVDSAESDISTNASAVVTLSTEITQTGTRNLIPWSEFGIERSGSSDFRIHGADFLLADLDLEVGDAVSISGEMKTDGTRHSRIQVQFRNSSSSIASHESSNAETTTWEYLTIEDMAIPSGCDRIRVNGDNIDSTSGTGYMRRFFLTLGPRAVRSSALDSNERDWAVARAQYSVEVDANGVVGGIRLIADSGSGSSSFIVDADTFEVWNGSSAEVPFRISGGTVYIKTAVIEDLSLPTEKVEHNAITEHASVETNTNLTASTTENTWTTYTHLDIDDFYSDANDELQIDVSVQTECSVDDGTTYEMEIRVRRNGSEIAKIDGVAGKPECDIQSAPEPWIQPACASFIVSGTGSNDDYDIQLRLVDCRATAAYSAPSGFLIRGGTHTIDRFKK